MNSTPKRCLALLALLVSACAGAPPGDGPAESNASPIIVKRWPPFGPTASWSTADLSSGATLPSGTTTVNGVNVVWEIGNYYSDNLQIYGLLCYPTSPSGQLPVAILNHGLSIAALGDYPAIEPIGVDGCTTMAGNGWITATSTYRGEKVELSSPYPTFTATSGGSLELCNGEVDDVLNLLSAVTAMPNANPSQVLMWGHSHGACITERAVERGAPVQVAVTLDGPTDFTTWAGTYPLAPTLAGQLARSSAYVGNDPAALENVQFLRIQAEGDQTVPAAQACELAAKLPGVWSYHLYSALTPPGVYYGSPAECAGYPITWQPGSPLIPDEVAGGTWQSPTLLMYSGLNHSTIRAKAWPELASFVNQTAKSRGWPARIPASYTPLENAQ